MIPQQFVQNYKCECFQPYNYCNCHYKSKAPEILVQNVHDVAATLVEVMKVCGIVSRKAEASKDVIVYYFLHFDEIVKRVDTVPRKRLSAEDLFHDLHRKCNMQRMEAQMAYSIIKRAFRAFYHGTAEGGVPNPWLSHQLVHTSACMWVHAAKRTAQLHAAYEGMFLATQKDIEGKIKRLYKTLYDRIMARPQPDENQECTCTACPIRIMRESLKTARVTTQMHTVSDPYEEMYRQIVDKLYKEQESSSVNDEETNASEKPHTKQCNCSSLEISENDLKYCQLAKSINTGYSQGPFDCHWFGISQEEYEADDREPVIRLPKEFDCPPCFSGDEDEKVSSDESECDCPCEICSCQSEDNFDYGEENADANEDEETAVEDENSLHVEEEAIGEDTPDNRI